MRKKRKCLIMITGFDHQTSVMSVHYCWLPGLIHHQDFRTEWIDIAQVLDRKLQWNWLNHCKQKLQDPYTEMAENMAISVLALVITQSLGTTGSMEDPPSAPAWDAPSQWSFMARRYDSRYFQALSWPPVGIVAMYLVAIPLRYTTQSLAGRVWIIPIWLSTTSASKKKLELAPERCQQ